MFKVILNNAIGDVKINSQYASLRGGCATGISEQPPYLF